MKSHNLGILLVAVIVVAVLGAGVYLYARNQPADKNTVSENRDGKEKKSKKDKKDDDERGEEVNTVSTTGNSACIGGKLTELSSWTMPEELFEISSIAWMGGGKIAAVQDNAGIIYIYDLASKKVEKKISFGAKGDYEGLTYANGHFFVMRSDANMFEVDPSGKVIKSYDLPLTATDNIEPFYYDAPKNRMLLGQKDSAKGTETKSFFAFDLASRKIDSKPVYTIDLNNPIVACADGNEKQTKGKKSGKKKNKGGSTIRPSEIVIDPTSKDILIADGPNHRILVLSPDGKPKHYLSLDAKSFPQVEGMLFTPTGELYISTEGAKQPAKISKMRIDLN